MTPVNKKIKSKNSKTGIKKSLILLSILGINERQNILENLNIKEKKYIIRESFNKGGFDYIQKHVSIDSLKIVLTELKTYINKKNISNYFFELIYITFLIPLYTILILNKKVEFDLSSFLYLLLLPFLIFTLKNISKFSFKTDFTNKKYFLHHTIIGIVSGILLYIILLLINRYSIASSLKLSFSNIIFFVLIIPFFEELIFRYVTINLFLNRYKKIYKLLFSSLLFSISHFNNIDLFIFIMYFFSGIILGFIYIEEKYIFPSYLAHSIANLFILFI